jgi:hypothetical protein
MYLWFPTKKYFYTFFTLFFFRLCINIILPLTRSFFFFFYSHFSLSLPLSFSFSLYSETSVSIFKYVYILTIVTTVVCCVWLSNVPVCLYTAKMHFLDDFGFVYVFHISYVHQHTDGAVFYTREWESDCTKREKKLIESRKSLLTYINNCPCVSCFLSYCCCCCCWFLTLHTNTLALKSTVW